jgi:hypothetical protein
MGLSFFSKFLLFQFAIRTSACGTGLDLSRWESAKFSIVTVTLAVTLTIENVLVAWFMIPSASIVIGKRMWKGVSGFLHPEQAERPVFNLSKFLFFFSPPLLVQKTIPLFFFEELIVFH